MYTREKLCRDENYKSRKNDINPPSFSSTLLDEIYRSIDGGVESSGDINDYKEKNPRRQSGGGYGEAAAASRKVEKWMEKEASEKAAAKKRQQLLQELDNDLIFFSSTSSSSDSSGALSSSDTEFFGSTARSKAKPPKVSCFTTRPKPVRTGTRSEPKDDRVGEDDLIKSKSRALKIYANLKKVKQPISPGGRLTTFINSLFSNANGKKSRSVDSGKGFQEPGPSTTCSSASSFSRSCLSKYSPRSREKMRTGEQRTVRFEPVSVIVDQDLRPCGNKSTYNGGSGRFTVDSGRFGRPPLPPTALSELKLNKKAEIMATHDSNRLSKGYNSKKSDVFYNADEYEEDDDEDCRSDSSSDLFELDHLAIFGSNRYSEELPVYETTHFGRNCAIASGLIR